MKRITLTKGKVAVVNDRDVKLVSAYTWHAHLTPTGKWYARSDVMTNGKRRHILMHRLILKVRQDRLVDHRDGDGLNNRRSNLRSCSHIENQRNQGIFPHTSKYKGVSWDKKKELWRSQIGLPRRGSKPRTTMWLGYHKDEVDAALSYDRAAKRHFGAFAKLNDIKKGQPSGVLTADLGERGNRIGRPTPVARAGSGDRKAASQSCHP